MKGHFLTQIIALIIFGFLSAGFSFAQTSTPPSLQALIQQLNDQIRALQNQISVLQARLNTTEEELRAAREEVKFTRSLKRGARGEDVRRLQEFLNEQFSDLYPEGFVTGYFGPLTESAMRKFQERFGIEEEGVIGTKTIERLNKLITSGAGASGQIPPGLLIAPGIAPLSTSTPPTGTSTPPMATTTPPIATSTPEATTTPSGTIPATPATPAQPQVGGAATPATPATPAAPIGQSPTPTPTASSTPTPSPTATTTPTATPTPTPSPSGSLTVSNYQVTNITPISADISFTTSQPATVRVAYIKTPVPYAFGNWTYLWFGDYAVSRTITLTGLNSDTEYFVGMLANSSSATIQPNMGNFRTLPASTSDTATPTISNVQVTNVSGSSATFAWTTDESGDSVVEIVCTCSSAPTVFSNTMTGNANTISHTATISNSAIPGIGFMSQGQSYNFRVSSADSAGNRAYSPTGTFTANVGGDTSLPDPTPTPTPTPQSAASWTRQFGSIASDNVFGAASDASGNTYIVGDTPNSIDGQTNSGSNDGFIAKYDASGNKAWVRQLGGAGWDTLKGAATDGSNVYAVGLTYGSIDGQASAGNTDAVVAKYDSSGNKIWVRQFGASLNDQLYDAAVDGSGNLYVSGHTDTSLDGQTNSGFTDALLIKYDSSGNKIWTRLLGTANYDKAEGLAVDSNGNAYISGWTRNSLDGQPYAGGDDLFVAKYDSSGNKIWVRQNGTPGSDYSFGAGTDSAGNVYASGYTSDSFDGQGNAGAYDVILTKYDGNGTKLWSRQVGGPGNDMNGRVAVSQNGVFVTGYSNGPTFDGQSVSGYSDAFLTKYDSSGNKIWSKIIGTASDDVGSEVTADSAGGVYVTGYTNGAFAGQTGNGNYDAFIAKYDSSAQAQSGASATSVIASVLKSMYAILEQLSRLLMN